MSRSDHLSGFTLVELMVTIAILAIICAMAAPSFSSTLAKQRLNSTTKDLINSLSKARSQAVLLRRDVQVVLNATQQSDTATILYWKPVDASIKTESGALALEYKNIKLTSTTTNITFTQTGTVRDGTTTGTNFIICNKAIGVSKNISLSNMGVVSYQADGASCTW